MFIYWKNLFGGDLGDEDGVFRQVDDTDIMAELEVGEGLRQYGWKPETSTSMECISNLIGDTLWEERAENSLWASRSIRR